LKKGKRERILSPTHLNQLMFLSKVVTVKLKKRRNLIVLCLLI